MENPIKNLEKTIRQVELHLIKLSRRIDARANDAFFASHPQLWEADRNEYFTLLEKMQALYDMRLVLLEEQQRARELVAFLDRPALLAQQIASEEDRLGTLRENSGTCSATITGMPGSTDLESIVEKMTLKIIATEERIRKLKDQKAVSESELILFLVDLSDPRCMQILSKRYIGQMTFREIAVELNYSEQHICRLHEKGLKEAERLYTQRRMMQGQKDKNQVE